MGLTAHNDSRMWVRRAPEDSYGVLPAQVLTFAGTPATGGDFTLSHRGVATAPIVYNAAVAAVQSAVDAAWGAGVCTVSGAGPIPVNPLTFTFASGPTAANPMLQAFAISADITGLTGGSPTATFTGGPVWQVIKVRKVTPPDNKPAFLFDKEERNSPDKYYEDSATQGGAVSNWKIAAGVRPDQIGHDLANVGLTDTASNVAGTVYDHAFKGGAGDGSSYAYQCYDGKKVWTSLGVVLTEVKFSTKSGEAGKDEMEASGWGYLADVFTGTAPSVTLPDNTTYHQTSPTNSGRSVSLGGSGTNLMMEATLTIKRAAKPIFTNMGSIFPYRPEFDDREIAGDMTLLGDETAETAAAKAGTNPRACVLVLTSSDVISTTYTPQVTINVHAFKYADYGSDTGSAAARSKFKLQPFYNTAAATQATITVRNEETSAY